jgi:hypothetical protein
MTTFHASSYQLNAQSITSQADFLRSGTSKRPIVLPVDKVGLEVLLPKVLGAVPECQVARDQSPSLVPVQRQQVRHSGTATRTVGSTISNMIEVLPFHSEC